MSCAKIAYSCVWNYVKVSIHLRNNSTANTIDWTADGNEFIEEVYERQFRLYHDQIHISGNNLVKHKLE